MPQLLRRSGKALGFIIAAHKGLDHAAVDEIFLHRAVHVVHFDEHSAEARLADVHHDRQRDRQHRQRRKEKQRKMRRDREGHDRRQHQHDRAAGQAADDEVHRRAHGVDIRCGARDEARRGKAVDVREGKALDAVEQHRPQVFREALAGNGRAARAEQTADHRQARDEHHDAPDRQHEAVALRDERVGEQPAQHEILLAIKPAIDDDGHQHRDEDLQHDLKPAEQRRRSRPAAIAGQTFAHVPERLLLLVFLSLFLDLPLPPEICRMA